MCSDEKPVVSSVTAANSTDSADSVDFENDEEEEIVEEDDDDDDCSTDGSVVAMVEP